ncbi:MAG: ABC transporter ATP-binding protein/permease [Thermoanaerobaculales bacterium]|nr:ABC transporter ATP-binding protein/permease [Thermoanaerobaculales bacterium]
MSAQVSEAGALRRLWPFLRPDWWAFVIALALTPAAAGLSLVQPYLLKRAIDDHVVPGVVEGLGALAFMYLGAVLVGYVIEGAYVLSLAWGGQRTILRLRSAVYAQLLSLRQSFLDRQPAGRLMTRATSDVDALGEAFSAGIIAVVLDLLMIVGTLSAMLWLDAGLTVVLLFFSPPLLWILNVVRKRLRVLFLDVREALASVNAFLAERVDGVEVVQLYGHEAEAKRKFDKLNDHFRKVTTHSNYYDAFIYALVDGVSTIGVAIMLWYGSGMAASWGLKLPFGSSVVSAGLLVAFLEYMDRLFRPLRELTGKMAILQRGGAALEKILDLLREGNVVADTGQAAEGLAGHIRMKNVWFRYRPESQDVLKGISLEIRPGEVVAVVGATGSGKTTLMRLLDTSYSGYRGSIRIDDRELRDLRSSDVRRQVAGVRQDPQLFSEAVKFNVDLDNPGINEQIRRESASLVHLDQTVKRIGWDHVLRERGSDLSVGEGQLLTFARAMAHGTEVVILDEATASIDTLTERLVQDALGRIFEQRTVIVVAHRLSTVERADRIVVMDGGRIVEEGSHAELMAIGGAYVRLVQAGEALVA